MLSSEYSAHLATSKSKRGQLALSPAGDRRPSVLPPLTRISTPSRDEVERFRSSHRGINNDSATLWAIIRSGFRRGCSTLPTEFAPAQYHTTVPASRPRPQPSAETAARPLAGECREGLGSSTRYSATKSNGAWRACCACRSWLIPAPVSL